MPVDRTIRLVDCRAGRDDMALGGCSTQIAAPGVGLAGGAEAEGSRWLSTGA